jgi:hypothetical protein
VTFVKREIIIFSSKLLLFLLYACRQLTLALGSARANPVASDATFSIFLWTLLDAALFTVGKNRITGIRIN